MTSRLLLAFAATLMLVACVTPLSGNGAKEAATANGTDEITVTSLDSPEAGQEATGKATTPAASEGRSSPQMTAEDVTPSDPATTTDEGQLPTSDAVGTTPPAVDASTVPAKPEELKSASQRACEKKGGVFANAGSSGAKVCIFATRDAGKTCRKESDCEGLCLARSRTCSPFTPVIGCQEILQQDGLQVTQCTE